MDQSDGIAEIRRRDRAKDDSWIRTFLHSAPYGHVATIHAGRPFLNSNLFVYDEPAHSIYFHTARVGRTPQNVKEEGLATFSASVMGRMLPAKDALQFSVEYASVIAFGHIYSVIKAEDKERALQLLMNKYAPHLRPGRDYNPITQDELRRTGVHRLEIQAWSGKEKVAPSDFPGAFITPSPIPPIAETPTPKRSEQS